MQPKILGYLDDVLDASLAIKEHTKEIKTYKQFIENRLVYRAVERELIIIAEAIIKIKKENQLLEIEHAKQIVGLRNRVIHDYANTNYDIIWGVVVNHMDKNHMDKLIKEIKIEISKFDYNKNING